MPSLTEASVRALTASAPWRFRTLHLTWQDVRTRPEPRRGRSTCRWSSTTTASSSTRPTAWTSSATTRSGAATSPSRSSTRCGCCPILWGEQSERDEGAAGGPTYGSGHPGVDYPPAYLVAVDVQCGIVVSLSPLGGTRQDLGLELTIHEVDAPMADSLFLT